MRRLIDLHTEFLNRWLKAGVVRVAGLEEFAFEITQGRLRCRAGMNVQVGKHIPLAGGPAVVAALEHLCREAHTLHPYILHQRFEHLHPMTDGNGRAGRLLWLWSMVLHGEDISLGFLHTFYYQSLEFWRAN